MAGTLDLYQGVDSVYTSNAFMAVNGQSLGDSPQGILAYGTHIFIPVHGSDLVWVIDVPAIQVLDPATGTGTFLRQTILQIYQNFCDARKGQSKDTIQAEWNAYVPEHLLPRINGFELMMAPYAVAHIEFAQICR